MIKDCFINFKSSISGFELPKKFNFPFYYDPHPLALIAAEELQEYISKYEAWKNCFGIHVEAPPTELGKMFGVLVVQNSEGKLGYLRAFSGKIIDTSVWDGFVPPLFDTFAKGNKFDLVSKEVVKLTNEYDRLIVDPNYINANKKLADQKERNIEILKKEKQHLKAEQRKRKATRAEAVTSLSEDEYLALKKTHNQESLNLKFIYKEYGEYLRDKLVPLQKEVDDFTAKMELTKSKRKELSLNVQNWIFDKYNFVNINGDYKNVVDIFKKTILEIPPSGAGDCAAPKLLQYAFLNNLKPIALAEFWWGKSPGSAIRKHKHFYPCCRGKCEPILGHMLKGMDVDPNPMLINPALGKNLEFVYDDEYIAVVNKPAEFLSVPGKTISDSVQERVKEKFQDATGPLVVHRLDMSTSGLLLIAKTKEVHKMLQSQFIKRTIQKRYVAVLEGNLKHDSGFIDLPLKVDFDNRPCQMVCYDEGKTARTKYEVIERENGRTKVYFYPITGRTHQLRMHAAHQDGLNAPIVGDDLYGKKADRLHLHAEMIKFEHPVTKEDLTIIQNPEF